MLDVRRLALAGGMGGCYRECLERLYSILSGMPGETRQQASAAVSGMGAPHKAQRTASSALGTAAFTVLLSGPSLRTTRRPR